MKHLQINDENPILMQNGQLLMQKYLKTLSWHHNKIETHILQLLANFQQILMYHSDDIRLNPLNPPTQITYKDQFSSNLIQYYNIRYSFYSYLSSKTFSFLNPIVL